MSIARHLHVVDGTAREDAMSERLKIAFASSDRRQVDQHFGSARSFVMYEVDADHVQVRDVVEFGTLAQDGNEDKLNAKIEALSGCAAVYVLALGGGAVTRLARIGVQPLKVPRGSSVDRLLAAVQAELRAGPSSLQTSPWIARALRAQHGDGSRFNAMEAEGWSE